MTFGVLSMFAKYSIHFMTHCIPSEVTKEIPFFLGEKGEETDERSGDMLMEGTCNRAWEKIHGLC